MFNYHYRLAEVCLRAFLLRQTVEGVNVGGHGKTAQYRIPGVSPTDAITRPNGKRQANPIFPLTQILSATQLELVG